MTEIINIMMWIAVQPLFQEIILFLFFTTPIAIYKYKHSKQKKTFDKLVEIATSICEDLVESKLSNENKKSNAMASVYAMLPQKVKSKVKQEVIESAVEIAYQEYVKVKKV